MADGPQKTAEASAWQTRLGSVPADYYYRPDVFEAEIAHVFKASWLCVGVTDDLANHQDFVTVQVGPHSIVVQNFRGELKAFRNVCSHRFSRIQTQATGNRPLQCPYHGWTYNAEGIPAGVPFNAKCFQLDDAGKQALALEAYPLETCGRFVFVNMDGKAPPLREFLGEVYDHLTHFTEACPNRIDTSVLEWDVNWKVGFENAAEGYHMPLIHPDSLAPTLETDVRIDFIGDHSVFYRTLSAQTQTWWDRVTGIIGFQGSQLYPDSNTYVIFPNICIMATHGASFVFQTFDPLSAEKFRFNSTYWTAPSKEGPARQAVLDTLVSFSNRVMGEDHDICAFVQQGVRDVPDGRAPLLGEAENRVAHFQTAYMARMKDAL